MMMLLQWPRCCRSPSRNQMPGKIGCTVSGLASVRATNRAVAASAAKRELRIIRRIGNSVLWMDPPSTEATWKKAQKVLQENFLFGKRSAKNQYVLRGLIKWLAS